MSAASKRIWSASASNSRHDLAEPLRFDVLVEDCLLLELKSVQEILPVHKAQLFSYMKLLNVPIGLIINFHEEKLVDGIVRMMLPGANR
jgi:GxxExxY protein